MEPETVQGVSEAFGEGVVLQARARNINKGMARSLSQTRQRFDSARVQLEPGAGGHVPAALEGGSLVHIAHDGVAQTTVGYPGDASAPHKRLKQPMPVGGVSCTRPTRFSELKNMPATTRERAAASEGTGQEEGRGVAYDGTKAAALRTQSARGARRGKKGDAGHSGLPCKEAKKERVVVQTASYLQHTLIDDIRAMDRAQSTSASASASGRPPRIAFEDCLAASSDLDLGPTGSASMHKIPSVSGFGSPIEMDLFGPSKEYK